MDEEEGVLEVDDSVFELVATDCVLVIVVVSLVVVVLIEVEVLADCDDPEEDDVDGPAAEERD